MGTIQKTTWIHICEGKDCGLEIEEVVRGKQAPSLPKGWRVVREQVGPCGLTNYYYESVTVLCPSCYAVYKK
jgi:hypothetical protein